MYGSDWQKRGIRFTCIACGACCIGKGYVYLFPDDVERLAASLGVSRQEFCDAWAEPVEIEFDDGDALPYLVLKKDKGDACVFLKEGRRCGVHASKPRHCKDSPFIPEFLLLPESFEGFRAICPTLGVGGLHPAAKLNVLFDIHIQRQERYEEALRKSRGSLAKVFGVKLKRKPWRRISGATVDDAP